MASQKDFKAQWDHFDYVKQNKATLCGLNVWEKIILELVTFNKFHYIASDFLKKQCLLQWLEGTLNQPINSRFHSMEE